MNTALPAISGTAAAGQTLSTTNGTWTNSPTGYGYQWHRCDSAGNNCTNIRHQCEQLHARRRRRRLNDQGRGHRHQRLRLDAGNLGPVPGLRHSAGSRRSNTALPAISGTATAGPDALDHQRHLDELADRLRLPVATLRLGRQQLHQHHRHQCQHLPLVLADAGSTIRVVVTATNAYGSNPATSAQYPAAGTVQDLAPVNTVLPAISGTAAVGQTLSTTTGTWTNSPTGYGYQWQRCDSAGSSCTNIGTSANAYRVRRADRGYWLRVVVTATNAYGSTQATSGQTGMVPW